ncbi:MAG: putative immunity protein, partial [Anaerolineales bacterium]
QEAARAAGQAAAVAHMATHELGAAAYAIRAAGAATPEDEQAAGRRECQWQRTQLPSEIRELVLDDQKARNKKYWSLFDGQG